MFQSTLLLAVLLLPAQEKPEKPVADSLQFKNYGFSIAPLEGTPGDAPFLALQMFQPATLGFSPNVNVQIRKHPAGLDDYIGISKEEFEKMKLKVVLDKKDGSTWLAEYAGNFGGRDLHFYARAEYADGKIFLVTGGSTEAQWAKSGPSLKKCVDSFKRN